jgi:hypothetical protein
MKLALQYLNDESGRTNAVQLSIDEWNRLMLKFKKYEVSLKMKSNLQQAIKEAEQMSKSSKRKQTLSDFLNTL